MCSKPERASHFILSSLSLRLRSLFLKLTRYVLSGALSGPRRKTDTSCNDCTDSAFFNASCSVCVPQDCYPIQRVNPVCNYAVIPRGDLSRFLIVKSRSLRCLCCFTFRTLKRLETVARSPLHCLLSAAVAGGTTIRAFRCVGSHFLCGPLGLTSNYGTGK